MTDEAHQVQETRSTLAVALQVAGLALTFAAGMLVGRVPLARAVGCTDRFFVSLADPSVALVEGEGNLDDEQNRWPRSVRIEVIEHIGTRLHIYGETLSLEKK